MFQHDRICCVCNTPGLAVQNPAHHTIENFAVLCLQHHDETQVQGGFSKRLKAADIFRSHDDWVRRVQGRRDKADELVIQQMAYLR